MQVLQLADLASELHGIAATYPASFASTTRVHAAAGWMPGQVINGYGDEEYGEPYGKKLFFRKREGTRKPEFAERSGVGPALKEG